MRNGQSPTPAILKDTKLKILLICDDGKETETILRLSRVGFDFVQGYLDGGFDTWKMSNKNTNNINSVSAKELKQNISTNNSSDIKIGQGDLGTLSDQTYDVILANINRNVLLKNAEGLYQRLRENGVLLIK